MATRRHESSESVELLRLALAEQEMNRRPGRVPTAMALNAYSAVRPLTREQQREADALDEMDQRYFADREATRQRSQQLDDAEGAAAVRTFQRRRDAADEFGPQPEGEPRKIRRFGTSDVFTDPDAAMSDAGRAAIDPRVLAANATMQGRLAIEGAKLGAKEAEKSAEQKRLDDEATATRSEIIRLAEELKSSPYLRANVGPLDQYLPTVRGGSKDFQAKADRLRNLLSLEARSKIKGQGQISDFEGKMLKSSQTALDLATDEGSFVGELDRIIEEQRRRVGGGAAPLAGAPAATGGGDAYDEYVRARAGRGAR